MMRHKLPVPLKLFLPHPEKPFKIFLFEKSWVDE